MSDEVVAQGVQAAGDVGQAHSYLNEETDAGLAAAALNDSLMHLKDRGTLLIMFPSPPSLHNCLEIPQDT